MNVPTARSMLASAAGLALCASLILGGCASHQDKPLSIAETVTQPTAWTDRTALDITNYHGSVRVIVDANIREPQVQALARSFQKNAAKPDGILGTVGVDSRVEERDGGQVVYIQAAPPEGNPQDAWVDLLVRVPALGGLRVLNRGGLVDVQGVSGAIQIENGPLGESEGDILVRTAAPMRAPVALVSEGGDVMYQIGPDSSGEFTLIAEDGVASFSSPKFPVERMVSDGNKTAVVFNGGGNPVLLRSEKGFVRAMVLDNPLAYKNPHDTARTFAWPRGGAPVQERLDLE